MCPKVDLVSINLFFLQKYSGNPTILTRVTTILTGRHLTLHNLAAQTFDSYNISLISHLINLIYLKNRFHGFKLSLLCEECIQSITNNQSVEYLDLKFWQTYSVFRGKGLIDQVVVGEMSQTTFLHPISEGKQKIIFFFSPFAISRERYGLNLAYSTIATARLERNVLFQCGERTHGESPFDECL